MDKAQKLLRELEQEIPQREAEPGSPEFHTVMDMLAMIAELIQEFTSGKASNTQNPYSRPVVKKALKMLADESGIKDPMDVDLEKLIRKER